VRNPPSDLSRSALRDGTREARESLGAIEPLQGFMTNPAGAAVVNTIGPIRQLVRGEDKIPQRYLVILPGTPDNHGAPVQVQGSN
jgi:hypothetical protein